MEWCKDLVNWGVCPALRWLYSVPNGAHMEKSQARLMVGEGLNSGVLDLGCPAARRGFTSLWIEFKVSAGDKLSPEQLEFIAFVEAEGACVRIAKNARAAQDIVAWYFDFANDPRVVMFN